MTNVRDLQDWLDYPTSPHNMVGLPLALKRDLAWAIEYIDHFEASAQHDEEVVQRLSRENEGLKAENFRLRSENIVALSKVIDDQAALILTLRESLVDAEEHRVNHLLRVIELETVRVCSSCGHDVFEHRVGDCECGCQRYEHR